VNDYTTLRAALNPVVCRWFFNEPYDMTDDLYAVLDGFYIKDVEANGVAQTALLGALEELLGINTDVLGVDVTQQVVNAITFTCVAIARTPDTTLGG